VPAINDTEVPLARARHEPLIRSRSGGLIAALTFSTLATGLLQICLPLELRQLRASPNEIGLTLSMFGFGMSPSNGFGASWRTMPGIARR
jgi:hypothetical protein